MHFGCVCDNGPSHVMSGAAIGRALQMRGHQFTLFGLPHLKPWIDEEEISSFYLANSPEMANRFARSGKPGKLSFRQIVDALVQDAAHLHRELPAAIDKTCVDCMVIDANVPAAASVAEARALPFVTFCSALPPHEESTIPPGFLPWSYDRGLRGRLRNQSAYRIRDFLVRPLRTELNSFRERQGLRPYPALSAAVSPLAQITQLVAEFDFPRTGLPSCFHYVGPYFRRRESVVAFPFERLNGRPLVYAALGTVLGEDSDVWTAIAQACAPLSVQLVVALGTRDAAKTLPDLPGDPIVVPYAPQEALLAKADLFITHAGLNSALESLAHSVPMLAIPFVADQMGVASRIVFRGVGKSVGRERNDAEIVRKSVNQLLTDSSYRSRCAPISKAIQCAGGADAAAEIIERVGLTRQPVQATPRKTAAGLDLKTKRLP
jgi:zeaxanthin glucosyltransferase